MYTVLANPTEEALCCVALGLFNCVGHGLNLLLVYPYSRATGGVYVCVCTYAIIILTQTHTPMIMHPPLHTAQ